jgi:hypothetical protein
MNGSTFIHPVDALTPQDKCRIYFSRVVDLAVFSGLLEPDPDSEIGHFAFSRHYVLGRALDVPLQKALRKFESQHPEMVVMRRSKQNQLLTGVVNEFVHMSDEEKIRNLILIGASYRVWPTCTSFTLIYPWDRDGSRRPVSFRDDLPEFMKRRILKILKKAGKLRNPNLFQKQ